MIRFDRVLNLLEKHYATQSISPVDRRALAAYLAALLPRTCDCEKKS